MLPDITKKLFETAEKKIKRWPCHTNRASAIGHECERHLYYMRTAWEAALPYDVGLQFVFDEGNMHEAAVLKALAEAGVEVIEQQTPLNDREHNISGHVDGVLSIDGRAVPLEIKSMSPYIWNSVFWSGARKYTWEEVRAGFQSRPWLRKYYAQLTVYMYLKDNDQSVLLCKNKTNGLVAQVDIDLDFGYAEELLLKAERINNAVRDSTPPDRIEFDNEVCRRCEYRMVCCPDEVAQDFYFTCRDEEVVEWCRTEYDNAEAAKQRTKARKCLSEFCKAHAPEEKFIVGDYTLEYTGNKRKQVKVSKIDNNNKEEA